MSNPGVHIDVLYSSHDGGCYAEVWEAGTGKELYSSPSFATPEEAKEVASSWVDNFLTEAPSY